VTAWGFETEELQITSLAGSAEFIYDGIHYADSFLRPCCDRGLCVTTRSYNLLHKYASGL